MFEATCKIYETGNLENSASNLPFGLKSTDYRIDPSGYYITNFATLKKTMSYTVEIIRTESSFKVGSFTFTTTK